MGTYASETWKRERSWAAKSNRWVYWLSRHWLLAFILTWGLVIGLPWLAPVFMKLGLTSIGHVIYSIYSFECHQLPERSYFLFGPKLTYSLAEIQAVWQPTNNPVILRQFLGNPDMGWKVAWCERTTWWYGSIWFGALVFRFIRGRLSAPRMRAIVIAAMPMTLDGGTHTISDLFGIGTGFRENNAWLATLTHHSFASSFYVGDAFGSFNSWMRITSGVILGLVMVWVLFAHVEDFMNEMARKIELKFQKAGLSL